MMSSWDQDKTNRGSNSGPAACREETTPPDTTTAAKCRPGVLRCSASGKKLRAGAHRIETLLLNVLGRRTGATFHSTY